MITECIHYVLSQDAYTQILNFNYWPVSIELFQGLELLHLEGWYHQNGTWHNIPDGYIWILHFMYWPVWIEPFEVVALLFEGRYHLKINNTVSPDAYARILNFIYWPVWIGFFKVAYYFTWKQGITKMVNNTHRMIAAQPSLFSPSLRTFGALDTSSILSEVTEVNCNWFHATTARFWLVQALTELESIYREIANESSSVRHEHLLNPLWAH